MNLKTHIAVFPLDIFFGCIKFLMFFMTVIVFLVHHSLISCFSMNEERKQNYFLNSIKIYSTILQKILNITVESKLNGKEIKGSLIVSNHLSYVDVLILFSQYPSLFITSIEIRDTFMLGQIAKFSGCFFVERRKKLLTIEMREKEINDMKRKLEHGFNVFLFPEGTSSDGSSVLPFKAHFFQLAESGIPVQPVCLKYKGESIDVVPWYGSMTFADHLFKVCLLRSIEAEIVQLPEIKGDNKLQISETAYHQICECYG